MGVSTVLTRVELWVSLLYSQEGNYGCLYWTQRSGIMWVDAVLTRVDWCGSFLYSPECNYGCLYWTHKRGIMGVWTQQSEMMWVDAVPTHQSGMMWVSTVLTTVDWFGTLLYSPCRVKWLVSLYLPTAACFVLTQNGMARGLCCAVCIVLSHIDMTWVSALLYSPRVAWHGSQQFYDDSWVQPQWVPHYSPPSSWCSWSKYLNKFSNVQNMNIPYLLLYFL